MPRDRADLPDDPNRGWEEARGPSTDRIRFIGETYRLLFEGNPLPMWVFDVKSQRFLAVNEAAVRRYGYTKEEFLRLTVRDILPVEDLEAEDRDARKLTSDTESFGIVRHRTKDGTILHVEALANEIDFNSHRARLVLAHDITDRLRIERSLRTGYAVTRVLESAATFHEAVPGILRAICEEAGWEYGELWRAEADRDALRWDGSWSIPGFPAQELERGSETVHVERGMGIPGTTWATGKPEWLTDLTARTHFYRVEPASRLRLKQALSFPITGHASRVLGVMVFFSRSVGDPDDEFLELIMDLGNRAGQFLERERFEADRRRLEERFTKAFYQNPLPAIISRLDGTRIIDVNDSFLRTFGYRRDELIEKTSAQANILQPLESRANLLEPLTRGQGVLGIEALLRTKSGELRTGRLWSERVEMGPEPTILTII
ncbi:MAG TPA: PAS domain S-box protein, partial [Thermoplasmata archaeon]|nr:PAS domain S-box protein [Thermoplasmata archaeon]